VLCNLIYHTTPPNLSVLYFDSLVTGLVLLLRSVNLNDHCSWCHYLSCVPTSKWSCKAQQFYCEVSALSWSTWHPCSFLLQKLMELIMWLCWKKLYDFCCQNLMPIQTHYLKKIAYNVFPISKWLVLIRMFSDAMLQSVQMGNQLNITCLSNGKSNIFPLSNTSSTDAQQQICSQLCNW